MASQPRPTCKVAFLFTDIEGSTRPVDAPGQPVAAGGDARPLEGQSIAATVR